MARSAVVPASWVLLCRSCSRSVKVCASILVEPCSFVRLSKPLGCQRQRHRDAPFAILARPASKVSLSERLSAQFEPQPQRKHAYRCGSRDSPTASGLESVAKVELRRIQTTVNISAESAHTIIVHRSPSAGSSSVTSRTKPFFLRNWVRASSGPTLDL